MLPLSDDVPGRRFPAVNIALIAANCAVWIFWELQYPDQVVDLAFYPCAVSGECHQPQLWIITGFTAMFLHGSWLHLLGNMVFLGIFGNNVEDSYGHARYLVFYLVGGWAATATQTAVTLAAGSATDAATATLGASGAISAVMGAYVVLYPKSRVRGLLGIFPVRLTAWFYLGVWFLYQLIQGGTGLATEDVSTGGVALYAHVGGFLFGFVVTWRLARSGRIIGASARPGQGRRTGVPWRSTGPGGERR